MGTKRTQCALRMDITVEKVGSTAVMPSSV